MDGIADRLAGGRRDRRDEADRTRRQLAGQLVVHRPGGLAASHSRARTTEHLPEAGEDLTQVGHVELTAEATQTERVGGSFAGVGIPGVIVPALFAVGIVSGGESERQVSHALNGTHRRSPTREPPSRSQ